MLTQRSFVTEYGPARILSQAELEGVPFWKSTFAARCKDHRYYEILAETLEGDFEHHYLLLEDHEGRARAIQPLFFVNQDLTAAAAAPLRAAMQRVRRLFPRCLVLRMLMVGSVSGEGHLGAVAPEDEAWAAEALHAALATIGRKSGASLVLLKDFPPVYRQRLVPFSSNGYTRIASMPMTRLELDFADFDEYMNRCLSHATRKDLRRKFRRAEKAGPITMEVRSDASAVVDEIYPLYLQVHERSALKFERLTREYLCRVGREMPDRTRFFLWRQNGKLIAFSLCMVHDGAIYDEYLGLDYALAFDLHLYFQTLRDVINWSVGQGLRCYYSTPLNYDPKLRLKFELAPLDLYVTHTSTWLNPIFRRVLPLVQPTRNDALIRQFANAHEL